MAQPFTNSASGSEPCSEVPVVSRRSEVAFDAALDQVLADVSATIAPLWPLADFVAVNPFVGLADQDFLAARERLRRISDVETLMPLAYFKERLQHGQITLDDVRQALAECQEVDADRFADFTADDVLESVWGVPRYEAASAAGGSAPRVDVRHDRMMTLAEAADRSAGTSWHTAVVNEVSKHCAAHYDAGQATWESPWRSEPLFAAWCAAARIDRRIELLGMRGFRELVSGLPSTPREAIGKLLRELAIPEPLHADWLLCQLASVGGWASYVKYRTRQDETAGGENTDLLGLLAIRLAYDVGLVRAGLIRADQVVAAGPHSSSGRSAVEAAVERQARIRYVWQTAAEIAYRRRLLQQLADGPAARQSDAQPAAARKLAQMVFCIDVRSEVFRRRLEAASKRIETFGFAGFFGFALEYVSLGAKRGTAQCPVLLNPGFQVEEEVRGTDEPTARRLLARRFSLRMGRKIWKSFQGSAASCFSFVESLGLVYFAKLLGDSLGWHAGRGDSVVDGLAAADRGRLGPRLPVLSSSDSHAGASANSADAAEAWIELAEGMLRNLGLTSDFARLVVLCGHGSATVNNPYQASFDCGACGGHSGEPNARFAAGLLNNRTVRTGLRERGIDVPDDVWFVGAIHITTTDEIRFCDVDVIPASHRGDLQELQASVRQAENGTRQERAVRLGAPSIRDLLQRSRDWSEVRPEWGLAGNAAFVIAPRSRTTGLDLGGRTFLHSYDASRDPDYEVLERILTAPVVVASWISLQYYASTVDNCRFGSGNKTLHNVVGQLGVLEGNAGDLRTGLPWQSVHDGTRHQHEPLRLAVIVEAPRAPLESILDKHPAVGDLARNGWLTVIAWEDGVAYRYVARGVWIEQTPVEQPA